MICIYITLAFEGCFILSKVTFMFKIWKMRNLKRIGGGEHYFMLTLDVKYIVFFFFLSFFVKLKEKWYIQQHIECRDPKVKRPICKWDGV